MRLMRYKGLLAVAAWQLAPVTVQQDTTGDVQVVVGFAAGRYEEVITTCEGDVVESARVPFGGGGISVEYLPTERARVTGYGGWVSNDEPAGYEPWDGAYLGGQLRLDWRYLGIGGGPTLWPGELGLVPNAYLRLGSREELHVRFDAFSPAPPLGATGLVRLGVGYNDGIRRGPRVFGGLAPCNAACVEGSGGAFLDVGWPVSESLDLEAGGLLGISESGGVDGAFNARVRLHFGAPK